MMIKYFSYMVDKACKSFEIESKNVSDESVEICQKIADFYFEKNTKNTELLEESHRKAVDEIKSLGVSKLFFDKKNNCLHFHLSRPGILIGQYGKNIEELQKFLGVQIKILETQSVEDMIINRLPYLDWE